MGKDSKISWTNHTFNPWWGCTKVAAGCKNCYAETLAERFGWGWGEGSFRRPFKDKHWNEPLKWNRESEKAGVRARVFCGSMCDVFEDRPELEEHRVRLWKLIDSTPWLDWLLLTKRPQNARRMLPTIQIGSEELPRFDNVWMGATVCTQEDADRNIPELLQMPAAVRFLSVEPLLERICVSDIVNRSGAVLKPLAGLNWVPTARGMELSPKAVGPRLSWVIVGGESGPKARPCHVEHVRLIAKQCKDAGVPVFVKQLGTVPVIREVDRSLSGPEVLRADHAICAEWPEGTHFGNPTGTAELNGRVVMLHDRAGADPSEWPADLRVRQMPEVPR